MFTARYALNRYTKQTRFVFKGLKKRCELSSAQLNNNYCDLSVNSEHIHFVLPLPHKISRKRQMENGP